MRQKISVCHLKQNGDLLVFLAAAQADRAPLMGLG
jgi:hypothetical protein